jgi:hypothetical protein
MVSCCDAGKTQLHTTGWFIDAFTEHTNNTTIFYFCSKNKGWTKFYEFSNTDLRVGAEIIDSLCENAIKSEYWHC